MNTTKPTGYSIGEMALDALVSMVLSTTLRAIADNLEYFPEQQANNIVFNTIFDSTVFGLCTSVGRYVKTKNSENSVSSGAVAASGSVIGHALYYLVKYSG